MKMKEKVLSIVKILVGVALTDIAFGMIVLPQSFAAGGVTGLCVINLWRKTHTLACGMKATFHLINT